MSDPEDPGGTGFRIVLDDGQRTPVDGDRLRATAWSALGALGVPGGAELSISLVDGVRIADLKEQAFGVRAVTDVLSFPIDDPADPSPGPLVLGDVVVCPAVAARQAGALGRSLADELDALLVHGILHLLGRDHGDVASERAMFAEERDVLRALAGERAS